MNEQAYEVNARTEWEYDYQSTQSMHNLVSARTQHTNGSVRERVIIKYYIVLKGAPAIIM